VAFGDLAKTQATLTVLSDGSIIEYQRSSADSLAFEPSAPHAGTHSLDGQTTLELRHGTDDDYDGAAQRAAGIEIFPEANELYFQTVQLIEHFEEVAG
jgi:hypothetical protein